MGAIDQLSAMGLELAKLAAVASVEPVKDTFRTRSGQLGAVTKLLRGLAHDEVRDWASPKGRDDFLWATANYLAPLEHEELVVAFGSRRGSKRTAGASLRRVHRTVGDRDRVPLTPKLLFLLDEYLTQPGAEVVLVHNHPPHFVKTLIREVLGWRPIASAEDRALALRFFESRVGHFLTSQRPSSFKWYLVDEGALAEFPLPTLNVLLAWASIAGLRR